MNGEVRGRVSKAALKQQI